MKKAFLMIGCSALLAGCSDEPAPVSNAPAPARVAQPVVVAVPAEEIPAPPVDAVPTPAPAVEAPAAVVEAQAGEGAPFEDQDLHKLSVIVQSFRGEQGRMPASLDELVSKGFVPRLPSAPAGKKLTIDSKSAQVVLINF